MAFELPPLPNFQTQVPQSPDVLGQYGKFVQLKDMLARQQLIPGELQAQQANLQSTQIENQLKELQLQGQQALTKWLQEGDTNEDIPAGKFALNDRIATYAGVDPKDPIMNVIRSMAQHGVPAPVLMAEAQGMVARRQKYNEGTEEQQKIIKGNYDTWKDAMGQLFNEKDPQKQSIMAAEMLPRLRQATHLSPELDAMANLLGQNSAMGVPIAYNLVAAQDKALALTKAGAEAKEAEQKVIPEGGALSPQKQQDIIANVKEAELKQPLEIQKVQAEARIHADMNLAVAALNREAQQAFQTNKDARDKIETTVLKPYQEKMTDVNMARNAIAQAGSNPVAARAAVFKMIGVAQPTGSHRVLPAEITAFRYPGGIGSQVVERFNDFLKGEPWTPEIAAAANAFIDSQAGAAQTSLSTGIDNTNKLYGTQVGGGLKEQAAPAKSWFSQFGGNTRKQ